MRNYSDLINCIALLCLGLCFGCQKSDHSKRVDKVSTIPKSNHSHRVDKVSTTPKSNHENSTGFANSDTPSGLISNDALIDVIPWKENSIRNFNQTVSTSEWLLFDSENMGTFQEDRGNDDYKKSKVVKQLAGSLGVDCYSYGGGNPEFLKVVYDYFKELPIEELIDAELIDDDTIGFVINIDLKEIFPINSGTKNELIQIFENARKKKGGRVAPGIWQAEKGEQEKVPRTVLGE